MRDYTIQPLDAEAMEACRLRIDNLTKPIYSLAHLENMTERLAGIFRDKKPGHMKMALAVFAADHAVTGPQNKTHGEESLAVLTNLNAGQSAMHAVARDLEASVYLVDVGLEKDASHLENVRSEKVMSGSRFFREEAAMTEEATAQAVEIGFALAEELRACGYQAVGLGNVGERAGLGALAVTAAITGYPMQELLEDNICSLTLQEKADGLTKTLSEYDVVHRTPFEILELVGSPEIAAMTGFILGAAVNRLAVVHDNAVTTAAVLVATQINPAVKDFVFASEVYDDPVHRAQLRWLDRKAFLHYGFTIEEGLGSAMGLSVLKAGIHMLNDMKTFGEADVEVAEDGPGNQRQDAAVKEEA